MRDDAAPGPLTRALAPQAPGRLGREDARSSGSRYSHSGDVDVLLAAEQAEVRRPFHDEWSRRAADAKANVDRPEGRAIVELVAGPRVAAWGVCDDARRVPARIDQLKVLRRGMRRHARVLELHLHGNQVPIDGDVGEPQREALHVRARA